MLIMLNVWMWQLWCIYYFGCLNRRTREEGMNRYNLIIIPFIFCGHKENQWVFNILTYCNRTLLWIQHRIGSNGHIQFQNYFLIRNKMVFILKKHNSTTDDDLFVAIPYLISNESKNSQVWQDILYSDIFCLIWWYYQKTSTHFNILL